MAMNMNGVSSFLFVSIRNISAPIRRSAIFPTSPVPYGTRRIHPSSCLPVPSGLPDNLFLTPGPRSSRPPFPPALSPIDCSSGPCPSGSFSRPLFSPLPTSRTYAHKTIQPMSVDIGRITPYGRSPATARRGRIRMESGLSLDKADAQFIEQVKRQENDHQRKGIPRRGNDGRKEQQYDDGMPAGRSASGSSPCRSSARSG